MLKFNIAILISYVCICTFSVAAQCGGTFNGSSGSIQSPNYPDLYDPNLDCYYSISTQEDTAVTLQIYSFSLETDYDFVEIYDGPTDDCRLIGRYTGHSWVVEPIFASTNQALVYFHSDSELESPGFVINFTERESCGDDVSGNYGAIISPGYLVEPYPNDQTCYYTVTTPQNTAVTLDIVDLDLELDYDYIEIYDGPNTSSPYLGKYSGVMSNVYVYATTNKALIYFYTDSYTQSKGFYIYFTNREIVHICPSNNYTMDSGVLTSALYPKAYPNNTDCYYNISTSQNTQITLQTRFIEIESSSNCSKDYVEVFDGPSTNDVRLAKLCGSGPVHDIVSSTNEVFVHFHSDSQNEEDGFNITYNTNPCPDPIYFYDDFGTIYSPGFPISNYPNFANCVYSIEAPVGSQVLLTVVYTNIQSTTDCLPDYIRIYDGPTVNDPMLSELCGSNSMKEFQASSNKVLVEFHSDSTSSGRGFIINYIATYNYEDDLDDVKAN